MQNESSRSLKWSLTSQEEQMSLPLIEVKNLTKVYHSGLFKREVKVAVHDVSFTLHTGEALGLIGESGSGKTTIGRLVLRLIDPTSGRISYKGRDITHVSRKEMRPLRREMQIIFQDPESSLNPKMRIYQIIEEPLLLYTELSPKERDEKIRSMVSYIGLTEEYLSRYPYQLSGGQNQRIVLARILILEPEFLVADEPTASLDVSVQAQIIEILKRWKQEHTLSILFISHDEDLIKTLCDRVIQIHDGRIQDLQDRNTS